MIPSYPRRPTETDATRLDDGDLDAILRVVAHELRGPLHALGLLFHLLEQEARKAGDETDGRAQQQILRGRRQVLRLARTVDDLAELIAWRQERLAFFPEPIDLPELLQRVLPELPDERQEDVVLSDEMRAPAALVWADPARLRYVLRQVLHNATQHTPAQTAIHLSLRRAADTTTLVVRDHGPGIDPTVAAQLLRYPRPRSTQQRGLGISLFLCRQLLCRQGGALCLEPAGDGGGLQVLITLPNGPPGDQDLEDSPHKDKGA